MDDRRRRASGGTGLGLQTVSLALFDPAASPHVVTAATGVPLDRRTTADLGHRAGDPPARATGHGLIATDRVPRWPVRLAGRFGPRSDVRSADSFPSAPWPVHPVHASSAERDADRPVLACGPPRPPRSVSPRRRGRCPCWRSPGRCSRRGPGRPSGWAGRAPRTGTRRHRWRTRPGRSGPVTLRRRKVQRRRGVSLAAIGAIGSDRPANRGAHGRIIGAASVSGSAMATALVRARATGSPVQATRICRAGSHPTGPHHARSMALRYRGAATTACPPDLNTSDRSCDIGLDGVRIHRYYGAKWRKVVSSGDQW